MQIRKSDNQPSNILSVELVNDVSQGTLVLSADGSFVYLIGFYGVDREESISVMLLNRVLLIIVSVVGGMLYIMENRSMNHTKTT